MKRNMKSVPISIPPKWCELIALGQKTIEVQKTIVYAGCEENRMRRWIDTEDGELQCPNCGHITGDYHDEIIEDADGNPVGFAHTEPYYCSVCGQKNGEGKKTVNNVHLFEKHAR